MKTFLFILIGLLSCVLSESIPDGAVLLGTTLDRVDDRNSTGYAQVLEESTSFGSTPTLYTYGLDFISQRQTKGLTSYVG